MQRKGVRAPPAKIIFQEGQTGDVGTPGAFIARSGLRDGGNVSHSGVSRPRLDCLQKVSVPFNGELTMAPKTNSGDKRCLRRSWAMTQNPFLAGDTRLCTSAANVEIEVGAYCRFRLTLYRAVSGGR